MKETLRHQEAFEYYYSLGHERSYPQVASEFTVSLTSIKKWAKSFNWQQKVKERDIKNACKLEEITNESLLASKAKYINIIQDTLQQYRIALQSGSIKITSVQDLEKLARLEMSLRENEITEEDRTVNIIFKTKKPKIGELIHNNLD